MDLIKGSHLLVSTGSDHPRSGYQQPRAGMSLEEAT